MEKYSFKISWLDDEKKFQVKLMYGNKELETTKYEWHTDMFEYISYTMAGLQIAGEDWTFSY